MDTKEIELKKSLINHKDLDQRKYSYLTGNFYLLKSAIRYYSVKVGKSFTAGDIADDFPLTIPVAGSTLRLLEDLDVIESRNRSKSSRRYMPQDTDIERLEALEDVLSQNYEIDEFTG
ncbi:MAG: hypothetical protein ABEJ99_03910 [Candidatus Nanohaloarchaea archaeon]